MSGNIPIEPDAVDLVIKFEESGTFAPMPVQDPTGRWEIGYGSIWDWRTGDEPSSVTQDTTPVDEPTARLWVGYELRRAAATLAADVNVPLTDGEIAALEDFIYNLGVGNFEGSTLLRYLNAGNYQAAADQLGRWVYAGGVKLAGLVRRRLAEKQEFLGTANASA